MNLQSKCYENIAETIYYSPPGIQEMIIGETLERIIARVRKDEFQKMRKEIKREMRRELKNKMIENERLLKNSLMYNYSIIIPQIVTDQVASAVENRAPENYHRLYDNVHVCAGFLESAIEISEMIAYTCVTERLSTGEDNFNRCEYYSYDISDGESDSEDSD